jgi:hypothetical protein
MLFSHEIGSSNHQNVGAPRGLRPWTPYQGAALLLSHEFGSQKRQNAGAPGGLRPLDPLPGRSPAPAGDLGCPQIPPLFYAPLSKKLDPPLVVILTIEHSI